MKNPPCSRKKQFYQICALFLLLFLSTASLRAQTTTLEYVKFVEFHSTNINYVGDYRWRFYTSTTDYVCAKQNSGNSSTTYTYNINVFNTQSLDLNADISLDVEAWQEDSYWDCNWTSSCGMGDCDYNSGGCSCGDTWHSPRSKKTVRLYNLIPGKENRVTFDYGFNNITFGIVYRPTVAKVGTVTYGATGTEVSYTSGSVCADNIIQIPVSTDMNPNFNKDLQYVWEYNFNNETESYWVPNPDYCGYSSNWVQCHTSPIPSCCTASPGSYQTRTKWNSLKTTYGNDNNGTLTLDLLSLAQVANMTNMSSLNFRVKTYANGYSASSYGTKTLPVSPRAPSISLIEPFQSCPNTATGSVKLSGIKGSGSYQFTIRPGHGNNQPCSLNSCLNVLSVNNGNNTIVGSSSVISGIPYNYTDGSGKNAIGEYTLWISNDGNTHGVCSSTADITIPVIADLSMQLAQPKKDATCHGYADGEIDLTYTGGISPYTYSLTGKPSNNTGIFSGLSAKTYTASVTDGCGQINTNSTNDITITEPKGITAAATGSTLTCESPADGIVLTTISDGPGTYSYYLKQNTTTITKVENTSIVSWKVSNRPAGSYTIEIIDSSRPTCPSFSTPVTLTAPSALNITSSNFQVGNVSCNDGTDGKITLAGLDMSGKYNYILTRTSDNAILNTSTNTVFADLRGANYSLGMMRNIAGCNDTYVYPSAITVNQPTPIVIGLTKQDITCYGLINGKINSSVSGGTGPTYSYTWEQYINSAWSGLSTTASSLTGKAEGTYRLKIKDTKNCPAVSDQIQILEPAQLVISSAKVNDIKCFGEKGTITLTSQGGTGTPTYQYSLAGSTYTTFTASTLFGAGDYSVRVKDVNNCITPYPDALPVTTPSSALDFTYVKSDFNGVNISCFNGANGYATLSPTGGNGGPFTGYSYKMDALSYQTDNKIEGINAGSHTISVMDGRGCVKSQTVTFTQSTEKLGLNLTSKKDVTCFGDLTGSLNVTGQGGISPYKYNINAGTNQSAGTFTGLGVGTHSIQLTDMNNCANTYDFEIVSLNPVIEINDDVKDVKCFGGQDGEINVSISGGVAPFSYAWSGQPGTGAQLSNIKSGTYKVTVTDNAGCKMDKSVSVGQPVAALKITVMTTPVCYGVTNGVINIKSSGGTMPYLYSIDDGNAYQSDPMFNTVGVGNYNIRVKDQNECLTNATAQIVQRNDKPAPDFIVATKESALDTLVITEISVPKPDSVYWLFDERAVVLDNNVWHPKIKFSEAGDYTVSMRGYFAGCDYMVTRKLNINPYDVNAVKTKLPEYKAIKSVEISPNPNSGQFTVKVKLNYKHKLSLIVYDIIGVAHYHNLWDDVEEATELIVMNDVASGIYLLRVITPSEAQDFRIIINK